MGGTGLDREELVDEIVLLLPVLGRELGRPVPLEMEASVRAEAPEHAFPSEGHVSPGHVQVLIALARGPRPVGRIAEMLGVSRPAATQLVDKLVEHGMIERRQDSADRRVVLVDYVPGMHGVARRIMEVRRGQLNAALDALTDEEALAFYKGLKEITAALGRVPGEDN
jgi:DNA-binding MarR family transcriptional regulator